MRVTRRQLLKGAVGAGVMASLLPDAGLTAQGTLRDSNTKLSAGKTTNTICPYCSVGCGIVMRTQGDVIVNAEGDPEHPINEGNLCSKGSSVINLRQVYTDEGKPALNPRRLAGVLYRAPGSERWEEKSWDWALTTVAQRVKTTRDASFETKDPAGITVNRTMALGHLGNAASDNEDGYAMVKLMRALGIVRLDHEARL